jgi:hypothetical protein
VATVTFLVHPDRADALALATDTAGWLHGRGDIARILSFSGPDRVTEAGVEVDLGAVNLSGSTVAVSLGGDGTFLRVVPGTCPSSGSTSAASATCPTSCPTRSAAR